MKECFKCNKEKPYSDFYKHNQMKDGHMNKCKSCAKKDASDRYNELSKSEEFMEKERERSRDKYRRLGYKDKSNKKFYHTNEYRNLRRKLNPNLPKNFELHHWSYKKDHIRDVIILSRKEHKRFHKYLVLDEKEKMFRTLNGELLDSRVKHVLYYNAMMNEKV